LNYLNQLYPETVQFCHNPGNFLAVDGEEAVI